MFRLMVLAGLLLTGCHSPMRAFEPSAPSSVSDIAVGVHSTSGLILLSWVGGISTLAGIAALVITRGSMGLRAVIAGVCLVLLNVVVANYLSWIMIPVLVATGCVSLCWAYVTIRGLINKDD